MCFFVSFFNGVCAVHVASMELPGGREDPEPKGRLRQYTPPPNKNKTSSRFEREIHSVSSLLLALVA